MGSTYQETKVNCCYDAATQYFKKNAEIMDLTGSYEKEMINNERLCSCLFNGFRDHLDVVARCVDIEKIFPEEDITKSEHRWSIARNQLFRPIMKQVWQLSADQRAKSYSHFAISWYSALEYIFDSGESASQPAAAFQGDALALLEAMAEYDGIKLVKKEGLSADFA